MGGTEISYPIWKSIAWRFIRAAVAGGIANILTLGIILQQDLSNANAYTTALTVAFITGAISAGGLALRDALSDGDKGAAAQKLPV